MLLCFLTFNYKKTQTTRSIEIVKYIPYNVKDLLCSKFENFCNSANNCDLEFFPDLLINRCDGLFVSFCTHKYVKVPNESNSEWFTKEITLLCNKSYKLYKYAPLSRIPSDWLNYTKMRNFCNTKLKMAKKDYFEQKVDALMKTNPNDALN